MSERIEGEAVPAEFVEQVKQALERLYDFPYLQQQALVYIIGRPDRAQPGEAPGQRLRTGLIKAIEALGPGPGTPFRAPQARLYNLLQLHYVEGRTIQETANELGISARQAYRDLRRGEESVAAILWAGRQADLPPPEEPKATRLSSVQAEMARLETHLRPTDINMLLQQAKKAVERLAQRQAVQLHIEAPAESVLISTDPVLAQQVLINLLSHAIQEAQPATLKLRLVTAEKEGPFLTLQYPKASPGGKTLTNQVVVQLTERLGWILTQTEQPPGLQVIKLFMKIDGPTVLVIDDNEGLVELLDRYLTGHACQVLAATSGQDGLRLAQEMLPDAIILDIMMPEIDGWELLQRLRAHPQTAATPVIICSVFNDPELAYSLGASLFLPKPVNRDKVLAALRQLGIV
jgi:CheY-like chemotaxis protein